MEVAALVIAACSVGAGVSAVVIAMLKHRLRVQAESEQRAARDSELVVKIREEHIRVAAPGHSKFYFAEIVVTNRSDRPNSIVSFALVVRNLVGPGAERGPAIMSQKLLAHPHLGFRNLAVPPVNIGGGTASELMFVGFEVDQAKDFDWTEKTEAEIIVMDGNGDTHSTRP